MTTIGKSTKKTPRHRSHLAAAPLPPAHANAKAGRRRWRLTWTSLPRWCWLDQDLHHVLVLVEVAEVAVEAAPDLPAAAHDGARGEELPEPELRAARLRRRRLGPRLRLGLKGGQLRRLVLGEKILRAGRR